MKKKLMLGIAMMTFCLPLVAQTADKPFKGKFENKFVVAELNLYEPTVETYPGSGEMGYGNIEGVYMDGRRIDSHEIDKVVSIDGNKAVVIYRCSFDGDQLPRTATLTYNPTTGVMTIENDPQQEICYQGDKLTFKSKKAAAKKGSTKKSTSRKKCR